MENAILRSVPNEVLFEQEYVEDVACTDEVDRAIIEELYHAGPYGILPRDVASRLKEYKLKPWNVTQRIRRMNKKLDRLIGQKAAEKRGKGWALTTFLRQAWGSTEEDLRQKFIKVYPFIRLESNGNGRVTRIEEMVNVIAQALVRVISKELKEQGVMFRTDEDPIEILQRYVTSLEKRHKETMA